MRLGWDLRLHCSLAPLTTDDVALCSLASVLEHCMYCGMSLARVGLDFRGLLPPIFEAAIANVFSKVRGTLAHVKTASRVGMQMQTDASADSG